VDRSSAQDDARRQSRDRDRQEDPLAGGPSGTVNRTDGDRLVPGQRLPSYDEEKNAAGTGVEQDRGHGRTDGQSDSDANARSVETLAPDARGTTDAQVGGGKAAARAHMPSSMARSPSAEMYQSKTQNDVEWYRIHRAYDLREKRLALRREMLKSTPMLLRALAVLLLPSAATALSLSQYPGPWVPVGAGAVSVLVLISNAVTMKVKDVIRRRRLRRAASKTTANGSHVPPNPAYGRTSNHASDDAKADED
jgi:hypothetical protein